MRGTRYEVRGASISITKFTELGWNDGVFVHIEEHQRCSGKRTVFFYFCEFWLFYTQRFSLFSLCFKGAKLAKFIRYEAMWKLMWDEIRDASISITKFTKMVWNDGVFEGTEEYRRCSGCVAKLWSCEVVKLWRCEDVILKYFALWRDSSLRCASFRMTRLYILLMIRNLFQWENCFWIAKIFFWIAFLSELSWRKFIRCKARWKLMWDEVRDASISITKFTENRWNDCVFERTEEHRRCCGKCTSFSVYACRKEHILL